MTTDPIYSQQKEKCKPYDFGTPDKIEWYVDELIATLKS